MRHFSTTILLSLGGLLSMTPSAIAQNAPPNPLTFPVVQPTVDVPFEGQVVFACSFDTPDPGSLVPIGIPIAVVLTSQDPGGTPGQVNILCNGESSLSVDNPVQTDGPAVAITEEESIVSSPFGDTQSLGTPLNLPAGRVIPLTVDMSVRADDEQLGFPPGLYRYRVTLVVTP